MPSTHDYDTIEVPGGELNDTHVLVGESGGLSAIYERPRAGLVPGLLHVETEHGFVLIDPDQTYLVVDG